MEQVLSQELLRRVVDVFYARVREDDLLGPIFESAVHDWPEHLVKLTNFWARVMLGATDYAGNPMIAHAKHSDRIMPAHFERWLVLWSEVTDSVLPIALARPLQERAAQMARGLSAGVEGARRGLDPALIAYQRRGAPAAG